MKNALALYRARLEEKGNLDFKEPVIVTGRIGAYVDTVSGGKMLNMCANNYLGFSGSEELAAAAKEGIDRWGFGLSAGRILCGTQEPHKELERRLSAFLSMEDTLLYSSCFDANGGLFETLLDAEDAVISDELNHASIIDGIRLCKAKRHVYKNSDMADLEEKLKLAKDARVRLIATDGVFSMEGSIANLGAICDLAEKYDALVMVDDSHATGFVGKTGRGSHEHCGVTGRVDIITGTLGKALGGASGGFTSARREIITTLRLRSRPYLFSNSLMPCICHATLKVLDILENPGDLLEGLRANTIYYREKLAGLGFAIPKSNHQIVPVILGGEALANEFAERLRQKGVFAVSLVYPVVALGAARVRTQVSAAHTREDLDFAVKCFTEVKAEMAPDFTKPD